MMTALRILRPRQVWGPGGRLPVSKSLGFDDYTLHSEADPFIPGTEIRRLRPVPLGGRAIGFVEAEVDAVVEGLVKLRDSTPLKSKVARA
jgi:hypothetical protein